MPGSYNKPSISYYEDLLTYKDIIDVSRIEQSDRNLVRRIWEHDYTLWKKSPEEIADRLGWLDSASNMVGHIKEITDFSKQVVNQNFRYVVVLGMGGSSLSCEVFTGLFPEDTGYPKLYVLDTTHPSYIGYIEQKIKLEKTLFLVSTKSGTTLETVSLMKYFYRRVVNVLGEEAAGGNFAAITDPGTKLETIAKKYSFRKIFINNPDIGGRFSVLSYFGLVPAALMGVDISLLLERSGYMEEISRIPGIRGDGENIAAALGVAIGALSREKVNKMYIVTSGELHGFNSWLEQLVAESTGKEGKSVLPVFESNFDTEYDYGDDTFFVFIGPRQNHDVRLAYDSARMRYPSFYITIGDRYDIGALFYLWEFAIATCGVLMGINPFDQPNVESTKEQTKKIVNDYGKSGKIKHQEPDFSYGSLMFYDDYGFGNPQNFVSWIKSAFKRRGNGYLCFQLFLEPGVEIKKSLNELSDILASKFHVPVTWGFGPRYLHSTGQLHKGDSGDGIYLQITSDTEQDLDIPDSMDDDHSSLSFGVLLKAQAYGDFLALREINRDIVQVNISGSDIPGGFDEFLSLF